MFTLVAQNVRCVAGWGGRPFPRSLRLPTQRRAAPRPGCTWTCAYNKRLMCRVEFIAISGYIGPILQSKDRAREHKCHKSEVIVYRYTNEVIYNSVFSMLS